MLRRVARTPSTPSPSYCSVLATANTKQITYDDLLVHPRWRDTVRIFEVGEVMSHARSVLEGDPLLSDLWVHGEISGLSQPASGHVYFDLRDAATQLKCVMFRSAARHLTAHLEVGQSVVAHGSASLYE